MGDSGRCSDLRPPLARSVTRIVIGLAVVFSAAACSDPIDDESVGQILPIPTAENDVDPTSPDGSDPQAAEDGEAVADPTTMAGQEALWAQRRDAVVARLQAGEFGSNDDGFLIGPGDFNVDLTRCPRGWTDDPDGDTIVIGHVLSVADYGPFADGASAYFDHVNATGGIGGRRIDYRLVDDELTPTKTIEAVDDWLDGDTPLAITTFGTPTTQAVFDQLNGRCIPQPFVGSAHPAWGDPRRHPWTTGLPVSYATEIIQWGSWIKRNLAGELPVVAGALVIDNDYGRVHQEALERWTTRNRDVIDELVVVSHDPSSPNVGAELNEIAEANPDVFMAVTAGPACGSVLTDGESAGLNESTSARFTATACADVDRFFQPAGRSGEGYLSIDGGVKNIDDPAGNDDPFVMFIRELLDGAGIDDDSGLAAVGAGQFAWAYVEALRIAAELNGGVTRSNLLLALRSLDLRHPMLLEGISFATEGADDAYPIEGSRMLRYSAGLAAWEPESLVVDLNRRTPTCSWDGQECG